MNNLLMVEPVAYQFRMRAEWVADWGLWTPCSKDQHEMYTHKPKLHDWIYETRALYASPPAQPWIRAVDEELVSTHLGIADSSDDYETAKKKLNALISWHVGVATDECFIPRISVDEYTKLAHRICSEYHHYDDRTRRAYTFEAHTLEQFAHAIENEVRKKYSETTTPSDFVI